MRVQFELKNYHESPTLLIEEKQGGSFMQADLYELSDVAQQLGVSPEVVKRFIRMGLVFPVQKNNFKFTRYGVRRLQMVLDLYEKSYPIEHIEAILNH